MGESGSEQVGGGAGQDGVFITCLWLGKGCTGGGHEPNRVLHAVRTKAPTRHITILPFFFMPPLAYTCAYLALFPSSALGSGYLGRRLHRLPGSLPACVRGASGRSLNRQAWCAMRGNGQATQARLAACACPVVRSAAPCVRAGLGSPTLVGAPRPRSPCLAFRTWHAGLFRR